MVVSAQAISESMLEDAYSVTRTSEHPRASRVSVYNADIRSVARLLYSPLSFHCPFLQHNRETAVKIFTSERSYPSLVTRSSKHKRYFLLCKEI